jgi:hypothetical protein
MVRISVRSVCLLLTLLQLVCVSLLAQESYTLIVQPGESIQAAVDAAYPGATINLGKGIWRENITINKTVTLQGTGADSTILEGKVESQPVLEIKGDTPITVTVKALKVTGSGCDGGIRVSGWATLVLSDSAVVSNANYGIGIFNPAQASISRCTISGNTGYGIMLGYTATAPSNPNAVILVSDCTISNNNAYIPSQETPLAGHGLWLFGSASVRIVNCKIWDNLHGLLSRNLGPVEIEGCEIASNYAWGILVLTPVGGTGVSKILVRDTRIVGNLVGGILLTGKVEATIEANQILRNGRYGIFLDEPPCSDAAQFTGYITGRGNTIAWNELADVCPQELAFLTTPWGGELDRRK